eukprot:359321-Pyramimonas_sp.AAC.1
MDLPLIACLSNLRTFRRLLLRSTEHPRISRRFNGEPILGESLVDPLFETRSTRPAEELCRVFGLWAVWPPSPPGRRLVTARCVGRVCGLAAAWPPSPPWNARREFPFYPPWSGDD